MADPPIDLNAHLVAPGDRLSKIAHERGVAPETIWDHPENAELKKKRAHGEILMPGDRVFIPEKKPEQLSVKPKEVNHFEVETIPSHIKVHLAMGAEPFPAGKSFEVVIDGVSQGKIETKGEGLVELYVEPHVTKVTLRCEDPPFECDLLVGHLDPIDESGGVEQRLNNLGYHCPITAPALPGASKAEEDAREKNKGLVARAFRRFQEDAGLPPTGVADEATLKKLDEWTHDPAARRAR
jgi:N-acetylmuramoyl-L-alanine amidase